MAVVRARSAPPYGLFFAVALAVICGAAAIVLYVMWNKQSAEHDEAMANLNKIANRGDMSSIVANNQPSPTEKNRTVIEVLSARLDATDLELRKLRAEHDSTLQAMAQQKASLDSEIETARSASNKSAAVEKDTQTALTGSQKTLDEKDETIKKLEADLIASKAAYDQAIADGEKKLNDAQAKFEQDSRDYVLKLEAANATISKQELDLKDMRSVLANGRKGNEVGIGEADGSVITVDAAAGNVWITLTKSDRIQPGMTFTTYDPRTGVRFGTDDQALGNGSIEVLQVGERNTLCRITRTTKNRAIQAGDVISNIVYNHDKTRKFKFVIVGDFDLDGDGIATANERERIIRMVKSWGGEVDDTVTAQTDYLVMGKPPASPATVVTTDAATAPGSIADERTKDQQSYDQVEQDARRLAIPVLNANRFLSMVGYYNTTVVRY